MFQWIPYPFVRIVAVFVAGILFGIYFPTGITPQTAGITLLVLLIGYFVLYLWHRKNPIHSIGLGTVGLSLVFLLGYLNLFIQTATNNPDHFIHQNDTTQNYVAVVTSQAIEKENTWKVEARMLSYKTDQWKTTDTNLILYFAKTDFEKPFQYGEVLIVKGTPQEISPPGNPSEFDYKRYLSFQNIVHQHYLRGGAVRLIGNDPPSKIMELALSIREWASTTIKQFVKGEQEQAIVLGLVLGIKDGLDNELTNAYAAAGGMHVLAVSGLHVGIIYWIVLILLKPLGSSNRSKIMMAFISVLILWAYAFVTGLSPSVLRAVTMFSLVAIAQPWKHRTNIFNTLAISAFLLLLYNPYLLMAVGFQLSYAAVLGIVYLQPMLSNLYTSRFILVNKIWELTTVSISAQVATFALGLLYFHQFPVYFLFSNLFIIPCAFMILVMGIVLLGFSFIPLAAEGIGWCLTWIVKVLNGSVFFIESLPYSLIENAYLTTFQCWLIILTILLILLLIESRKIRYLVIAFVFVTVLVAEQIRHIRSANRIRKLTVYNISGHSAVDVFDGGVAYALMDSLLAKNQESIRFHIQPNRLTGRVSRVILANHEKFTRQLSGAVVIKRDQLTLLWVYDKKFDQPINIDFDLLIISNNAVSSLFEISIKSKMIILDSSNSSYLANRLTSQAEELRARVHNTRTQGAFVLEQNITL